MIFSAIRSTYNERCGIAAMCNTGYVCAHSCLTELNETHVGLLWETGAEGCSASSNACLQVFSSVPLALFG